MHHIHDVVLRCAAVLAITTFVGTLRAAPVAACIQPQYGAGLIPASNNEHVVINANHASANLGETSKSTLNGAVTVSQKGRIFATGDASLNNTTKEVHIPGPSVFRGPNFAITSQSARFNLNTESGIFTDSKFVLPTQKSHGSAKRLQVARSGTAQLDRASYTTCAADNESWLLTASSIHLDQDSGIGTARNAVLHFQGIPILWLPWFRFPIDGRRRTGFLYPTLAQSGKTGIDIRIPFYINLAPNYDDVFTPRFMSRRGVLLGNRFRYLFPHTHGVLSYQYLPNDNVTGTTRDYVNFQHQELLTNSLGLNINFQQVSDIEYFNDFGGAYIGTSLSDSSTPFLPRGATLTFRHENSPTTVQLLAESYQPLVPIDNVDDRPYKRMPELLFHTITRNSFHGLRAGASGNFNQFERDDSVTGQRWYADPYLSFDVDRTSWFADGRIDGTWTQYHLVNTTSGAPRGPNRTLPIFSAGGGLRFDRRTSAGMLQTLEPQLFYLYVPYQNQDDLPIFDTGQPDFDFPGLLARNRFTGEDRISDANHMTGMITTHLTDPRSGLVKLNASAGVIYRFRAPRVTLPGVPLPSSGFSDLVGNAAYHFNRSWEVNGATQWDTSGGRFIRASARIQYSRNSRQRASIDYQYQRGLFNQADVSFVTPIADNWHLAGRLIYSFRHTSSLSAFGGVEYETCCWAVQAGARRYISNVDGDFSTGVFIQFTLKGLTSLGSGWYNMLPVPTRDLRTFAPR